MNLDKLRIFHHAGMAKSFTNCGLHLSPSAISRHISDLEYWLKVKLFVRHPKGMTLTPEGEKLLETCHTVFKELEGIKSAITLDSEKPEGLIKITTPSGWIGTIIIKLIKPFLDDNPAIRLSIKSFDGVPDFSRSEADIALLPFIPEDAEVLGEKLLTLNLSLFASPEYLLQHGTPKTVEDLKDHQLISYGDHDHPMLNINWHLGLGMPKGEQHEPYLTVNNLYYAAEAGHGIVTLAQENILLRKNRLVPVLPELKGPAVDSFCVYPKRLEKSKRIQTFLHYMKQETHEHKWL
ncbi:MAG: LysR family transcriptional regulator [Alphaproteobacteria bacterium]|nr:LysR family transcriptional regulator [Alphaproteobacteria bacterium]NCP62532.1 LysR family transcriptional regulator [Alphaproteobacteria bacterium]NCQ66963.1 LysR family transcriptional regulator [Alphaproteobacteria bacterium]NCT07529.1 LysR family transcriptional regulator [Alphaproteobacteria bacterium]